MRLAGLAVLAVLLLAGTPLAAQTVLFTGAVNTLSNQFGSPAGVAVDQYGNVFVTDNLFNGVSEILAVNGSIPANPTIKGIGSGFNRPGGVAVDQYGDVFVADTYNNAVKEVLAVNGSIPANPTINTLGSGFDKPWGVAVDQHGNVYAADQGNSAVKEILAPGGYAMVNTLGSGFASPDGVAVDQYGDVFVADTDNTEVKEIMAASGSIPANNPTINVLGSGFSFPTGVAVDGSGNVYVADYDNNAVKEILAVNGSIPLSNPTINTLGGGFTLPTGVAVDQYGHVFVANPTTVAGGGGTAAVKEIFVSGNFGFVNVGSPSANIISFNFTFGGSVTLGSTAVLTQGAAGLDFTDAGSGTCTANTAYIAGETCGVNVTFTPATPGPRYGAVQLLDTSGNLLAFGYMQGTGIGPRVNFLPGTQGALGSGLVEPTGVAVDASGNVYAADSSGVHEILAVNGSIKTLGSGFDAPTGVAVDGSGNVFVADGNNSKVKEILAVNGSIPANPTIITMASPPQPTPLA